jgi:hypothetical protein
VLGSGAARAPWRANGLRGMISHFCKVILGSQDEDLEALMAISRDEDAFSEEDHDANPYQWRANPYQWRANPYQWRANPYQWREEDVGQGQDGNGPRPAGVQCMEVPH